MGQHIEAPTTEQAIGSLKVRSTCISRKAATTEPIYRDFSPVSLCTIWTHLHQSLHPYPMHLHHSRSQCTQSLRCNDVDCASDLYYNLLLSSLLLTPSTKVLG